MIRLWDYVRMDIPLDNYYDTNKRIGIEVWRHIEAPAVPPARSPAVYENNGVSAALVITTETHGARRRQRGLGSTVPDGRVCFAGRVLWDGDSCL